MDPSITIPTGVPPAQQHTEDTRDVENKKRKVEENSTPRTLEQLLSGLSDADRGLLSSEFSQNTEALKALQNTLMQRQQELDTLKQDRTKSGSSELDAMRLMLSQFLSSLPAETLSVSDLQNLDVNEALKPEKLGSTLARTLIAANSLHTRTLMQGGAPARAAKPQPQEQLQQATEALHRTKQPDPPQSTAPVAGGPISTEDLFAQIRAGHCTREAIFADGYVTAHKQDM